MKLELSLTVKVLGERDFKEIILVNGIVEKRGRYDGEEAAAELSRGGWLT